MYVLWPSIIKVKLSLFASGCHKNIITPFLSLKLPCKTYAWIYSAFLKCSKHKSEMAAAIFKTCGLYI